MSYRKKPCRVCRKWYKPSARGGHRQKTCGETLCRRAWHAKSCREWREANPDIAVADRLGVKLEAAKERKEARDIGPKLGYPAREATEILGIKGATLLHFVLGQLLRRVRDEVGAYPPDKWSLGSKVPARMPRDEVAPQVAGMKPDRHKVLTPRLREQIASREEPG